MPKTKRDADDEKEDAQPSKKASKSSIWDGTDVETKLTYFNAAAAALVKKFKGITPNSTTLLAALVEVMKEDHPGEWDCVVGFWGQGGSVGEGLD
jgi:hypothetical protein